MSGTGLFVAIFSGTWALVGAVFLAVGIGMGRAWRRKQERLRAQADGVVLEVIRHAGCDSVSWRPLVEFDCEGRRISLEGDAVSRKRYYEGQPVRVRYDPDDPSCFSIEGENGGARIGRVFTAVGAACVAVAVIAALLAQGASPKLFDDLRWGL